MKIRIISPTIDYKDQVEKAKKELCKEFMCQDCIGTYGLTLDTPFEKWLDFLNISKTEKLKYKETRKGTQYLVVNVDEKPSSKDSLIGFIVINHELNDSLAVEGGNVVVSVLSKFRRKGIGKAALNFGVREAVNLGLKEVLLTAPGDDLPANALINSIKGVQKNFIRYNQANHKWINRYYLYFDDGGRIITKRGGNTVDTNYESLAYSVDADVNGVLDALVLDARSPDRMYTDFEMSSKSGVLTDKDLMFAPPPPEGFIDPDLNNATITIENDLLGIDKLSDNKLGNGKYSAEEILKLDFEDEGLDDYGSLITSVGEEKFGTGGASTYGIVPIGENREYFEQDFPSPTSRVETFTPPQNNTSFDSGFGSAPDPFSSSPSFDPFSQADVTSNGPSPFDASPVSDPFGATADPFAQNTGFGMESDPFGATPGGVGGDPFGNNPF